MLLTDYSNSTKMLEAKQLIRTRMAHKAKTGAKLNSGIKTSAQLTARIKQGDKVKFDYQILADTGKTYE